MSVSPAQLEDGTEIQEFMLLFSKKGRFSLPVGVSVSFEVAAKMRHPDRSAQKQQEPDESSEPKRRRRRRRRRR